MLCEWAKNVSIGKLQMTKGYFYLITLCLIVILDSAVAESNLNWPAGTYGLPEPTTGCPTGWWSGSVYHNTEDDQNINRRSNSSYHMSGVFNNRGIEQTFCMKLETNTTQPSPNNSSPTSEWPSGVYCIYKKGECPVKFESGSIFWDDEKSQQDLPNSHDGSVPDGEYTPTTTLIYFCCTDSGSVDIPVDLPKDTPFYLFPYKNRTCQAVNGMKSSLEFLFFDDNDEGNRDKINGAVPYGPNPDRDYNILLYSCYYEMAASSPTSESPEIQKEILKDTKDTSTIMVYRKSVIVGIGGLLMLVVVASMFALLYRKYQDKIKEKITSALKFIRNESQDIPLNEENSVKAT